MKEKRLHWGIPNGTNFRHLLADSVCVAGRVYDGDYMYIDPVKESAPDVQLNATGVFTLEEPEKTVTSTPASTEDSEMKEKLEKKPILCIRFSSIDSVMRTQLCQILVTTFDGTEYELDDYESPEDCDETMLEFQKAMNQETEWLTFYGSYPDAQRKT